MLISRNLDDQRFVDIVQEAESRLPWLCPVWSDHNAHDPGITILELMAWFKESQQYEMNRITPEIARKLLELAGTRLCAESAAECALEISPDAPARAPLSELSTPEGVVFELAEEIPAVRPELCRMEIERPDGRGRTDITTMLSGGPPLLPFDFGGESGTALRLGFSRRPEKELRLWFHVALGSGVQRNAPDGDTELPRRLLWELSGVGAVEPLRDETMALSWSGYVTLPAPAAWQPDGDGIFWLTLRQTDAGCEEKVRLSEISAGRFRAVQTESRARAEWFTVEPAAQWKWKLHSAQARRAETAVFLREEEGWRQFNDYKVKREPDGLSFTIDTEGVAEDGDVNILIACLDPLRLHDLLFDATGRPGEVFRLNLGGKGVLTDRLTLMCQTLCPDGEVRLMPWHFVEDLSLCGPRDLAFTYDRRRETIIVGDGAHGALVAGGEGAVMVVEELVSLCGEGNIPADAGLCFTEDGELAANGAAHGGRGAETMAEGRARLLRRLKNTKKCVSTEDYERRAMETPGLRVAGAKALPGFDVRQKHQRFAACVSVAVLPQSDDEMPRADERFLAAVDRQLERNRPVCIRTEAIPVRYAGFTVSVRVRAEQSFRPETAREAIERYFAPAGNRIGAGADRDDLAAVIQALDGVYQADRIEYRGLDQNSYQTAAGDLTVPPDTILHLTRAEIILAKDRR